MTLRWFWRAPSNLVLLALESRARKGFLDYRVNRLWLDVLTQSFAAALSLLTLAMIKYLIASHACGGYHSKSCCP